MRAHAWCSLVCAWSSHAQAQSATAAEADTSEEAPSSPVSAPATPKAPVPAAPADTLATPSNSAAATPAITPATTSGPTKATYTGSVDKLAEARAGMWVRGTVEWIRGTYMVVRLGRALHGRVHAVALVDGPADIGATPFANYKV